jgi:DNA primase
MSFPPSFLSELRDRLTVSEIVGKRLRLTRAGREYKACCPFHNEKTPSFYINDDKQFYHCFGCGAHGDIIGFLMRHDRLSFPDAVEQLAALASLEVPRDTPVDRDRFDKEKRLYQLLERTTAFFEEQLFAPSGNGALNYLRGRGLSDEAIRRFRLGYAPNDGQMLIRKMLSDHYTLDELMAVGLAKKAEERDEVFSFFRNRVMFPVGDRKGRTVAFGARILGEGEPKYLNSPDHALFHKGKLLYGLSRARTAIAQGQPIIVAEGYMDVIALVEAGYSGAIAPLGTALTEDQLAALWKLLPPPEGRDPARDYSPILCFDGDNAGQRAAARAMERALPLLTPSQTARIATMPPGLDPDDLLKQAGKPAMDAVLKQAKPMIEMIWDTSLAGRRLNTPEERGAFIANLKQRVGRIGNEHLRQLYQDDIQKRLAAAFNWGGENRSDKTGGKNRADFAPIVRVSRNPPLAARRQRERALLALMINHPGLFADFGEDFAHIGFAAPEFEALRQRVTALLSLDSPEPLDAPGLYRHLSATGEADFSGESGQNGLCQAGLAEVLSEATYMHVAFARSDRPFEQARQGWKSIWSKMLEEQLKADLEAARRRYAQDSSDESYTRLMALREQIEGLAHAGEDSGFTETGAVLAQEN